MQLNNILPCVGDPHFGLGNTVFLESQMNFYFNQFIPYLIENQIKKICIFGDLFDTRRSVDVLVENRVLDLFQKFSELGIEVHIILGNHDIYHRNSLEVNSLRKLELFDNVIVYKEITKATINNQVFLFVPWQVDLDNYLQYMANNDVSDVKVQIGHFDVIGAKMGPNQVSNVGFNKQQINRFPLTLSGHYHSRSIEKVKNNTLVYIGVPYQLTRTDKDEDKGFCPLNCETLEYEFISNTVSIKFVDVVYPEEITREKVENNIVDLHIQDDIDIDELETYKDKIWKFKPVNMTPRIISSQKSGDDIEIKIKGLKEMFKEYAEQIDIEDEMKTLVMNKIDVLFEEHYKE